MRVRMHFAVVIMVVFTVCFMLYQSFVPVFSTVKPFPVIVVDAGHGGEDGGTTSISGVTESGINLAIAKKLEQLLVFCGFDTVMTREDGNALHSQGQTIRERKRSDLNNRVDLINSIDHAVLLSIHQNHFPDPMYSGPQVFYARTGSSKELALELKSHLDALNGINSREIKQAESVYLMDKIRCTGVLVECGFLSNPQEDKLLQSDIYQRKLSCAIVCGIAQFVREGVMQIEV